MGFILCSSIQFPVTVSAPMDVQCNFIRPRITNEHVLRNSMHPPVVFKPCPGQKIFYITLRHHQDGKPITRQHNTVLQCRQKQKFIDRAILLLFIIINYSRTLLSTALYTGSLEAVGLTNCAVVNLISGLRYLLLAA